MTPAPPCGPSPRHRSSRDDSAPARPSPLHRSGLDPTPCTVRTLTAPALTRRLARSGLSPRCVGATQPLPRTVNLHSQLSLNMDKALSMRISPCEFKSTLYSTLCVFTCILCRQTEQPQPASGQTCLDPDTASATTLSQPQPASTQTLLQPKPCFNPNLASTPTILQPKPCFNPNHPSTQPSFNLNLASTSTLLQPQPCFNPNHLQFTLA